jgi:hypothetical protein
MGRSLRLPSSTWPPSRNTMVRNPSHLGSKLQGPRGSSATGLASFGATGGISGRSMPPVSSTWRSPWSASTPSNGLPSSQTSL